jgi:3-phenylpropionate/trans-cinnamate dioxygenase ferredoxin reductase component
VPEYKYLIVGGGMTADAAVQGIRQIDTDGPIGIISNESYIPYNRPPLSKGLWKGDPLEKVFRTFSRDNATLHLETTAKSIDALGKRVIDSNGTAYSFEKLLLATGGSARHLPYNVPGLIYFRTLEDYYELRKLTDRAARIVVVGGGFIGSEIAAALAMSGRAVTMIFPDGSIGARIFSPPLSRFLNDFFISKGVQVLFGDSVTGIVREGDTYTVTTRNGKRIQAEGVVAGIGIGPNVELALATGLAVENGILVDEMMRTRHVDIFAAGDVANFHSPALGRRIRVEHEDNANVSGRTAGANMAGAKESYTHLPFFYSDLFELGYEAVGDLDSRLEIVEDWQEGFQKGVLYYLGNGLVKGVLLWNVWGQVEEARKLIVEHHHFNPSHLRGRVTA